NSVIQRHPVGYSPTILGKKSELLEGGFECQIADLAIVGNRRVIKTVPCGSAGTGKNPQDCSRIRTANRKGAELVEPENLTGVHGAKMGANLDRVSFHLQRQAVSELQPVIAEGRRQERARSVGSDDTRRDGDFIGIRRPGATLARVLHAK